MLRSDVSAEPIEIPEWNETEPQETQPAVLGEASEEPLHHAFAHEVQHESIEEKEPEQHAGSYVIEGGQVEHEEIDDEETDLATYEEETDHYRAHDFEEETLDAQGGRISGEIVGEAIRESEEEEVLEDEEYEFNGNGEAGEGDEFEESELVAGVEDEEEPEDGHAELRAPAGTASYQQRHRTSGASGIWEAWW